MSVSPIYKGQFGEFTITENDRRGVILYRSGLTFAALSFASATWLLLQSPQQPHYLNWLTPLYGLFSLGLALSLLTIHIYLVSLHRLLQLFWIIGTVSAIIFIFSNPAPLGVLVYENPLTLLGIGFTFAALTGIYFKEAFCFDRLPTKVLTPLVPFLLLGHLFGWVPDNIKQFLLIVWSVFFITFAITKFWQPIADDIGDKSVFAHLQGH
ncbi:MAG: hypothetical protein N5P05_000847 [Chroococcopsis gigantea SAG 12.99]|jgi:uncharacterized integral membrane protein|nr:DUF2301 domain-containing membrane protein [Chlorogloea purpurea SAG 13.99]MDV2999241.1 hypothetical protein [Chroococcopsis gigantea SAG 12.99]